MSALDIAAAILAGGRAERLGGRPKGLLPLPDGRSIIERELAELRAAGMGEAIIVANRAETYRDYGVEVVGDLRPGLGPLAGVEAALAHYQGRCGAVLLLPCDLPAIGRAELAALAGAYLRTSAPVAVAVTGGSFWQPLCAVVHIGILAKVSAALDAGRRRALELWEELGAAPVRFADEGPFFNVNTPEDLSSWLKRTVRKPSPPR